MGVTPARTQPQPGLALRDRYGRVATDLRVSLTDRCNLRCQYCMPAEGLPWLPAPELLTDDELVRLVRIAVERLGVREVRFTGGEPTLRPSLVDLVARLAELRPRPELSMTTNGVRLSRLADALRAAGLDRVNVSLDTLNAERYQLLTRRARLSDVLEGLDVAADAGLAPVKVNAVLVRGINDDEAPALAAFCLARGYELRFIEQMPLDAGHGWSRDRMVTAAEIETSLKRHYRLEPLPGRDSSPAELFEVDGGVGRIGMVASVSNPFCAACDRVRLTADGQVRTCLFAHRETDLRGPLRAGADDHELTAVWARAMRGKPLAHGIDTPGFRQPTRPMSAIGG